MLPLPAGREASAGVVASVYERHRPERTLESILDPLTEKGVYSAYTPYFMNSRSLTGRYSCPPKASAN